MKTLIQFLLLQPILCLAFYSVSAQDKISSKFGHGINLVAADSSFSMKFTVRVQSQYEGNLDLGTNEYTDGFQIRRARLKFSGFMYNPKVEYKVELALSNADIEGGAVPESGNVSNIFLDAYNGLHLAHLVACNRLPTKVIVYSIRRDAVLVADARDAGAFVEDFSGLADILPCYLGASPMLFRDALGAS